VKINCSRRIKRFAKKKLAPGPVAKKDKKSWQTRNKSRRPLQEAYAFANTNPIQEESNVQI